MLELEGDGGPLREVREREGAGRPDDVDPLDPLPKVVPETAERFVQPSDSFDRRSVPPVPHGHEPTAPELAVGVGHGLDREPEALRDGAQLGRLEGGALVQEEQLGDRTAPSQPGEARGLGRSNTDHGARRPPANKTVFTNRESGLA